MTAPRSTSAEEDSHARSSQAAGVMKIAIIVLLAVVLGSNTPVVAGLKHDKEFEITTLSSHPDKVTAGGALIRIDVPSDVALEDVVVTRNGADVKVRCRPAPAEGNRALLREVRGGRRPGP